ncbi:MAG: Ig-like domain-containing protein [Kiritimatiellae bacterium]|jgi:hyaluronate lyase|nr:Ig-like domain-containing protein [Kiritimatiellia bacterium]
MKNCLIFTDLRYQSRIRILNMMYYAVLSFCLLVGSPVVFADEFDDLRLKWKTMTTGSGYDTNDPDVQSRLISINNSANYYWSTLDTSSARTYLWDDAASTTISAHLTTSYSRLRSMTLAYATTGCSLEGNSTLLTNITSALDWMNLNRYNTVIAQYDNWWDWEIGVPRPLTDIAVLLYDQLTSTQRSNYMNAVNFHTPVPDMTQANLIWKARIVGVRGCVVKDVSKIAQSRDAFSSVFPYVTSNDGFYRDGSFLQHTWHPYTAGYGKVSLTEMTPMLMWLTGSTWEVTDPTKSNLFEWVYNSYEPIIYKGAAWDLVRGREPSRSNASPQGTGHSIMQSILRISQFAPPADKARMRSMVKYWAQSDTVRSFLGTVPLTLLEEATSLMEDASVEPRGELVGHYQLGEMDRAIHLQPGYGFGLSMHSDRIANFESINGENMRGWHTGDGMTILYNADLNHYGDAYWPTVDAYRLPGTTIDTMELTPPTNSTRANGQNMRSSMSWVGGAELGDIGCAGMQLDAWNATLTAKKSWFMFENEIVCLGAGITSSDSRTIETIIENRKLNTSSGSNTFTTDGTVKSSTLGWSETLYNVSWAHLAGNVAGASAIGYYFPRGASFQALREARTGSWYDININYSESLITRNYLTLWYDHGSNPVDMTYAYVLLPNHTVALFPTADAFVRGGDYATNNYGVATYLVAKNEVASSYTRESYLRFDLSSQTNGVLIDAAVQLTCNTCNGTDEQMVSAVTDHTWSEESIVWTNKPVSGIELSRWSVNTNVPAVIQAAVGPAAKTAIGGPLDLCITALGGSYVSYASREYQTQESRPQLILTYANLPPTVTLTAPASNTSIHWTQAVILTAAASGSGGTVTNVSYYDNGNALGQRTEPPYLMTVTNLTPGVHSFIAEAIDDMDSIGISTPIELTVTGEPITIAGKVLTLKDTPVDIDLRPLVRSYMTPSDELCFRVEQPVNGAVILLPEQYTSRFTPVAGFTGEASFSYDVADWGINPQLLLHYDMEQDTDLSYGKIADASGKGNHGSLDIVGTGAAMLTNDTPPVIMAGEALALHEEGDFNGVRIRRLIGKGEIDFSDQDWSFAGWFKRDSSVNADFSSNDCGALVQA